MHRAQHVYKLTLLSFFLILFSITSAQSTWYDHLLEVQDQEVAHITTNVRLTTQTNEPVKALSEPDCTLDDNEHFVFVPGRADHVGKFIPFFEQFLQKRDANIWCIDPYGQGKSSGGVVCEHYDASSDTPCCYRRGYGTWEDYICTYVNSISGIYNSLKNQDTPKLTVITHSMAANVDMCARLQPNYSEVLNQYIDTMHYVSPMVKFTLFMKEKLGETGEEALRYVFDWATWGACFQSAEEYFFMSKGPVNAHHLRTTDVEDKVHPDKALEFLKVCRQDPLLEIGSVTNMWFQEACRACQRIEEITPQHFRDTRLYIHVPGDDKVVYPYWVINFFQGKGLAHNLVHYPNEPHNLFWGSEDGIDNLINALNAH